MTATAPPLQTYRGDPDLKAGLIREAIDHREQDRLIRGTYVQLNGTWRGCAVGCTVAGRLTPAQLTNLTSEYSDTDWHQLWAETTGCPEWLAYVEDDIFEGLPLDDARQWPVRVLTATPVGVDLTAAREAWLRDLVFDTEHGALALAANALESAGVAADAARMAGSALAPDWSERLTAEAARLREIPATADWESARAAASSARAAAWSASDAAWSARDAASSARDAASSARDAASSARAAAWSARAAAWSARAAASSARDAASSASAAASSARAAASSASDAAWSARDAASSASDAASSASDAAWSARDAAWQWIADRLIHHLEQSGAVAS